MNLSEMMRFIEQTRHTQISLEVLHPVFYDDEALKLAPDQYIHHTPFCVRNKMSDGCGACSASKRECVIRAESSPLPFFRICPFGVREIVRPIRLGNRTAAVLFFEHKTGSDFGECRRHARFLAEWIALELEKLRRSGKLDRKQKRVPFYLESAKNYIDAHYSQNIGLTDLADFLQVNPNYLGGLLKRHLGENFHALLTGRRIREAKILLQFHPEFSIERIGVRTGFSDSNYFSAVFRKKCGMPPRAWREKYANKPGKEKPPFPELKD